jgi:hypothetical protein
VHLRSALVAFLVVASAAAGQEGGPRVTVGQLDLETYRYAVSAERRSIMEANIGIDLARRPKFFAIYDDYDKDRRPVDTERFGLLQRYAAAQSGVSEPQAMALVRAVAGLQIKEIQLRSRYADRIDKELGGLVGARFYQVDDVITTAIRLNALQGVPLAGAPQAPR